MQRLRSLYCVIDVPDALLTLLRWCLLALLYLFFFRVLQATWHGAKAPAKRDVVPARSGGSSPTQTKPSGRRRKAAAPSVPSLVFVEPPETAGSRFTVNGVLTMGRAAGCEITLDDTYISQLHARVSVGDHGIIVEDLGSTNGTYLNRKRVTAPVVVSVGDRIQVGSTIMELQ